MTTARLRLGISRCLLGDEVRFDGGHKRDHVLTEVLGRYVEWIPVCPEVEAGLGTPREAMRLVGDPRHPRLMTISTRTDHTKTLETTAKRRILELKALDLSGYVFKSDSPSCGVERVRVYNGDGMPRRNGVGLFARVFLREFPLMPIEEEGRLRDARLRENFIERVFCYRRYQDLLRNKVTKQAVEEFHTIHTYLIRAHSQRAEHVLGRLVGQAERYRPMELAHRYGELLMKTLAMRATVRNHVNVLRHILSYFGMRLSSQERAELLRVIDEYQRGLVPLIVPLTLIKHYAQIRDVGYIRDQVYLNPHPKELMLRNHV